ncbi:MAG: RNA polymerase sigma factor, partial [bacterium]
MPDYTSHSDQQLAQLIQHSDAEAFKTIYYRYYRPLFRFAFYRTHSKEISQDLIHDTFARLWSNRERLDPEKSLKAYLYRTVNNLVIDHLRHKATEEAYLQEQPPAEELLDQLEDDVVLRERIENAIAGLPENARLVFMLYHFEGFKYAEITEALEISVKTVESRMSKALQILREKLKLY